MASSECLKDFPDQTRQSSDISFHHGVLQGFDAAVGSLAGLCVHNAPRRTVEDIEVRDRGWPDGGEPESLQIWPTTFGPGRPYCQVPEPWIEVSYPVGSWPPSRGDMVPEKPGVLLGTNLLILLEKVDEASCPCWWSQPRGHCTA